MSVCRFGFLALATLSTVATMHGAADPSISRAAWGMAFGVAPEQLVSAEWLVEDTDGDGQSNSAELASGTNPQDATSVLAVSEIKLIGKNVEIAFPTVVGKSYTLQENVGLSGSTVWEAVATPAKAGTGSSLTFSVPKQAGTYYRVVVQDVDADSDGISDYAENVFVTNSELYPNGPPNTSGGVSTSAASSIVTVSAPQSLAYEDGPAGGMFTVTRTGDTVALIVGYTISGTATRAGLAGADHNRVSGSTNMAIGQNSFSLPVMPVVDGTLEAAESCTLTITWILSMEPSGPWSIPPGTPNAATVLIYNSALAPNGTGLLGQYYDTASTTYSNSANFNATQLKVSRVDPTVDFNWLQGTPNGAVISPNNSPDNYSATWEGYLQPTTAGTYIFQLDADDKARVLLDTGAGLNQILEHGWDTASTVGPTDGVADNETIGTFKQSAPVVLAIPANPAARYRIRVEHVESTGDATCRLQWNVNGGTFANIPQAQVFSHTQATTYSYTNLSSTTGTIVVTPTGGHSLSIGNSVNLKFSSGNLFTAAAGYNGAYTITAVNGTTTFTVGITGTGLPATGTGAGFVDNSASTTTGVLGCIYANTSFSASPGRIAVDSAVTASNNGIWGTGTPDPSVVPDTFSVRWTGQVLPQYSEEYTFVVNCEDAAKLWINGQPQTLRVATTASSAGTYTYNSTTGNMVVTHTNIPAGSFAIGETVRLDPTAGTLTSLAFADYPVTAIGTGTFTVNVGTAFATQSTASSCNIEWINKPIDWTSASNTTADRYARISLMGGVRYDIRLEYFENTSTAKCQLSWYSASQTKQIIPQARLFPANSTLQPANVVSATSVTAYAGGPFTYVIAGTNGGTFTVAGRPAWLNIAGNVLSGTPPAGLTADYQLTITITNSAGSGASIVNLHVQDNTATPIVREYWSGVTGTTVATIPTATTPTGTANLTSLEAPTDFGEEYGARIRGYLSAPTTGNYYFWIAGSNAAELWISNDADPVNAIKRAYVTTGTASQEWNAAGETHQKSAWLALEEGKKYYLEILHKAGTGAGDNLAVGWATPGQSGSAPSQVVPGYALTPYIVPAPGSTPGTLYFSTMLAQAGAVGLTPNAPVNGVGTATLRVSENETVAILKFNHSGLTGSVTQKHIHADPYLTHPSQIIFDIDAPENPGDGLITSGPDAGGYQWTITDRGTLTAAEMKEIIKQGKAYINLHTALNPNGEIRGNLTLAAGSRTFSPPPAPPSWSDDSNTDAGAARFLAQATFGPNIADVTSLKTFSPGPYANRYEAWIEDQFLKPASQQLPEVLARELSDAGGGAQFSETLTFNAWWRNSVIGDDQLRQRVAYALSQIHVVSAQGPLDNRAEALSYFYDKLADNAFGSFRTILETTTLAPAMGRYLDMLRNDKPDQSVGRIPNENYAREIKQLFSLGLYRMWPDGTLILDSQDSPIDTYTQREIVGFSHVFTGWDYGYDGAYRTALNAPTNWTRQMREVPARHYTGPKRILNNEVLPGLTSLGGQPVDPLATHVSTQYNDPAYQALPAQELAAAHDQIFNHPNVGPFVCRQLIQRLVTSHPSRDYLYRVVQKFNDNGSGVRGDMKAVVKAILLDYEARSTANVTKPSYGKQREAVLRVAAAARAFRQGSGSGSWDQGVDGTVGGHVIRVTMPNKFAGGNTVFLEFAHPPGVFAPGDTTPSSEAYTVLSTPAPTSTVFYVNAKGWTGVSTSNGSTSGGISGTYVQTNATTITVTLSGHWLPAGGKAYLDFELPSGTAVADGVYTAATSDSTTGGGSVFTIAVSGTTGRSGRVRMVRFQGSYTVSNSGLAAPQERRITLDTIFGGIADHHLVAPNPVFLNFTVGNPQPLDDDLPVESVPDSNTFTVLTNLAGVGGGNDSDNGMWMFPLVSQPVSRSGTSGSVIGLSSTYNMGFTDADIDQTPLNSPTVFNFFLPDFKYPGALASQGLTTPEFQDTAETSVVRQSNFIYNGLFNPSGQTNGISSFKTGTHALVLDLSPWMGNATDLGLGAGPQTGEPWTSNANLPTLINQLNTLLIPGQMAANRRTVIEKFLYRTMSNISISVGSNPCIITSAGHGLVTGDSITISGVAGGSFSPSINGTFTVTVIDANTFTVPVDHNSGGTLTNAHFSAVAYDNAAPSDTHKRDRLRSILHLLLTSPDYTIQR